MDGVHRTVCFPMAEQAALLLRQTEGRKDELVALITSIEPAWVKQNYLRDETITAGNATLVAAQNRIALAHARL
jgi:hypothetical protein